MPEPIPNLKLSAKLIEPTEKAVKLEWTLVNGSPDAIVALRFLFRDFDSDGKLKVEPDLAYITVHENGDIEVAKKLIPVPEKSIQVFTPFVPLGVLVPPGKSLTETITLELPIKPWDHYTALIQAALGPAVMKKVEAKAIRFQLGVYRPRKDKPPQKVETAMGELIYPNFTDVLEDQQIVESPSMPWKGEAYR